MQTEYRKFKDDPHIILRMIVDREGLSKLETAILHDGQWRDHPDLISHFMPTDDAREVTAITRDEALAIAGSADILDAEPTGPPLNLPR